jgi:hypothetical protein
MVRRVIRWLDNNFTDILTQLVELQHQAHTRSAGPGSLSPSHGAEGPEATTPTKSVSSPLASTVSATEPTSAPVAETGTSHDERAAVAEPSIASDPREVVTPSNRPDVSQVQAVDKRVADCLSAGWNEGWTRQQHVQLESALSSEGIWAPLPVVLSGASAAVVQLRKGGRSMALAAAASAAAEAR